MPLVQPRVDASGLLRDPRFWGLVLYDLLEQREDDEPDLQDELFGVARDALNAWYVESIERQLRAGTWPFVRIPLDGDRALELELAGGVEYQNRYWLCAGGRRALAGYHSGHFSLPAFRVEEALRTGASLAPEASAAVTALMLTGCWTGEATPELTAAVAAAVRGLPGVRVAAVEGAAPRLAARLVVEDGPAWSLDPARGWTNDGVYSQRNPESRMSVLGEEGFATIRAFFGEPA